LQKMGRNMANLFFIKQGWSFFRDVWNIRRHRNSIYVPKMGVLVLTHFSHFYTHFFGDLLYFLFLHILVDIINNLNNILY
jgi:hypothetical protein